MILTYHHVAPIEAIPIHPPADEGWAFTQSPAELESHLVALRAAGNRVVSLAELVDHINEFGVEEPNTAVITFDDGWSDQLHHAVPILRRLNVSATFFVTSRHVGASAEPDPRRIQAAELLELHKQGMTIGAHSRSHVDLARLDAAGLDREVRGCKEDLQSALGIPIRFFAFPGGSFNARVVAAVRRAGFDASVSSLNPGRNDATSLFWMYRELPPSGSRTIRSALRGSRVGRVLREVRARRQLGTLLRGARSR